jgi:hypothetical protein
MSTQKMRTIPIKLPRWVEVLFARFTAIYREKWTGDLVNNEFVRATKWEWASDLTLRTADEVIIDRAIDLCKNRLEWPPTISKFIEFYRLARDEMQREEERRKFGGKLEISPYEKERTKYVDECDRLKKQKPDLSWDEIFKIIEGEISEA